MSEAVSFREKLSKTPGQAGIIVWVRKKKHMPLLLCFFGISSFPPQISY